MFLLIRPSFVKSEDAQWIIKVVSADEKLPDLFFGVVLLHRPFQDGLNAEQQFFRIERLGDIVVGTDLKALQYIFFKASWQ